MRRTHPARVLLGRHEMSRRVNESAATVTFKILSPGWNEIVVDDSDAHLLAAAQHFGIQGKNIIGQTP